MKMIDFLKKGIFLVLFVIAFLSSTAFAQTFVNNTNGDDFVGDGSLTNPYRTIAKAIAVTAASGTISIAADTYGEANVAVNKALTFVASTFNNLSTVTITNGITINTAGAADIVSLGVTGQKFNLGTTATALVLTKGNLQITTLNVVMGTGATLTRTAGTLDSNPTTTTNLNVTYNGTTDLTSGGELVSSLGSGLLTVNITAGKKLTAANGVTTTGGITITTGNVEFNGNLNLSTSNLTNTPANTLTFNGNVNFTTGSFVNSAASTVTVTGNATFTTGSFQNNGNGIVSIGGNTSFSQGKILNAGTGSVTVSGSATWTAGANISANAIDNISNGDITFNGAVSFVHASTGAADYTGAINNGGTGNVTLAQGFTVTTAFVSSADRTLNISATNASSGKINFNGAVALVNLTNNAGTVTLTGGTVSGAVANNTALGTLDIKANTTFSGTTIGNGNAAAVIKLNSNTLTFSNANAAVTNTGKIISATAATIGSGIISVTGTLSTITGGEIPNVTVASGKGLTVNGVTAYGNLTSAGTVTLAGALSLKGNYDQNVGGSLVFGVNTFTIEGNWTRVSNVPGDVTQGTGQLLFTGANAQTFTSGASLILYDVTINKTNATDVVSLGQTVSIDHNFTVTKGVLALGDNHVRMITAGGAVVNNGGYTSSGIGYIIFEAATANISGTATFSNIDVRNSAVVTAVSNINFSGNMNLRKGTFAVGANVFTFKKDLVAVPSVFVYTDGPGAMTLGGGSVVTAAATTYDLTYTAVGNAGAGAEWTAAGIRNLSVLTGGAVPAANTITGPAANTSIAGNLTVIAAQTLALGANTLTLASDNTINNIYGTVTGGFITVTGNGVALTGSTVAADAAEVPSLNVNTTASQSFSSSNIKKINGSLVVANGSAAVTMNSTTATITGNVTLTAGSLNLNMASTTSTHIGNVVLTDGVLTYTRGSVAAQQIIGGTVTLTAGALTLGSSVAVTGATNQVAGNLALGTYNYTAKTANYTRTGAGTLTGDGKLIVGGITLAPGATFKVPNLELDGAVTISAAMEVTNSLTHTSGAVDYNGLTFSGNTYAYVAGTIATGITFTGSSVVGTFSGNVTIPSLTINSTGSVTIASNNATPRTITATAFTQTKGDLNLGINTLQTDAFTRVAGNWTQGTGYLIMNTGLPTLGTGFAIDNLQIPVAVNVGTDAFTVTKNLVLKNTLTTSADGKLTLSDGILVERQANTATLSHVPTFGANTNLLYSTGAGIVAAKEMPATVNNMTVNSTTSLGANVTVNGTLSLAAVLTQTASTKLVTMAAGSTLELKIDNASNLNLTIGGAVNIIYNGATVTSPIELGTIASGAHPVTLGDVTIKTATVTVDVATHTFAGKVTFNGGNLAIGGQTVNLQGDVKQTTAHFFTGLGTLAFTGANNTALDLAGTYTPVAGANFTLNKTNANNSITVTGGNLDFSNIIPTFTKGVLTLGTNVLTLKQDKTVGNQPIQGFVRTSGLVYGTVKKFIDKTATVDISKVEFPVGTADASYRLATFYFNAALQSSFDLSVGYTPIAGGQAISPALTILGVTVDSTADFGWNVSTSTGLAPSQLFDVEFLGTGYAHYTNVADIRVVSKLGGAIATNPWLAQGGTYQNYEIAAGVPSVRLTNSTGNLVNIPGAFFAFGYKGITPPPSTYSVSGKVQYANATTSPVKGVVVTLNPGGVTATTDTLGAFTFTGFVNGSYSLSAASAKTWPSAAVNATDAYMVARAYAELETLTQIQTMAADVNANGAVNNTDALQIIRRFAGLSSSFAAGDWAFIGNPVTVANANVTNANIDALAVGDVNASASASSLQKTAQISMGSSDEALKVNPKEAFNVSVKVSEKVQLGAVSVRFTYPSDLVTFEGVSSKVEGLVVRDNSGEVTIGWADLSGGTNSLELKSGNELFVFKFKPTEKFKSDSKFQLGIQQDASEFVDANGKPVSILLKSASVEVITPEKFALLQNYPNPFNPTTVIQYDITNKGTVNLSVYNVLGQVVATVVNEIQEAGTYKVNFNGSSLASGAYFYRINVVTDNGKNFNQVLRMMLLK